MKSLDDINYYEILQLPVSATTGEIKRAYKDARSVYKEEALATYSLFPDADRDDILLLIEKAYETLVDKNKRAAYDNELVASGQIDESIIKKDPKEDLSLSLADNTKGKENIVGPVSNLHSITADEYRQEMMQTIEHCRKNIEIHKFDKQGIRNHFRFSQIKRQFHEKGDLSEIEPELQAMLADIEESSLRIRRNISFIILLYTLIAMVSFVLLTSTNAFMLPSFNIPYSILLMGLIGCIASMYLKLPNIRSEQPLRYDLTIWFIICPPVAVILAGISYGVLQIFLPLIPIELPDDSWVFLILAFFVGFVNWIYFYESLKGGFGYRGRSRNDTQTDIPKKDEKANQEDINDGLIQKMLRVAKIKKNKV